MTAYAFACGDYPGMEGCPGKFQAETEDELNQLIETHARIAHGEDVSAWSDEEKSQVRALIRKLEQEGE